ncbi:hypothetical protein [Psychroserpens sp. S379A]|uniref:hypothetical protein n=1 Tax=Psychroserpens sp. S379A TaxID=3415137 RepID=UPI003C7D6488
MNSYKMRDFQSFKWNKSLVLLIGLTFLFGKVYACDLCGCSTTSGSTSFGDLSMSNFVGLRYIHQSFESRDGIFEDSPKSKERFNTYQLWGTVPINDSFYMSAVVPFQDLTRDFQDRSEQISGLGDINVMGWYRFKFYKKKKEGVVDFNTDRERSDHVLNIGLGVKFPTGEFEEKLTNKVNPGFQVGTGSLDVFPTLMYGFSKNNIGVIANMSYYFKSENKNDYKFGNQFSYATSLFYNFKVKLTSIKPFVGVSGDVYDSIEQFDEELKNTDGSIFNASVGSEFTKGKFLLGAKYTLPLKQNLLNGDVESKQQLSLYLNFSL